MRKRIASLFLVLLVICACVPFAAFAVDTSCSHNFSGNALVVDTSDWPGFPVPIKMSGVKCVNDCGLYKFSFSVLGIGGEFIAENDTAKLQTYLRKWIDDVFGQNATATKAPTGIGRKDLGYASDDGTPSVSSDGNLQVVVYPSIGRYVNNEPVYYDYPALFSIEYENSVWDVTGLKIFGKSVSVNSTDSASFLAKIVLNAPISGTYSSNSEQLFCDKYYSRYKDYRGLSVSNGASRHLSAGQTWLVANGDMCPWVSKSSGYYPTNTFYLHPVILNVVPDDISYNPTSQTNITINNNTWTGNIYSDNRTNLTYIYPQYTTVNEKNETVTNISNNPIIYNSETQQYYTYDSVTNNYYYITYEQPATPTPSPCPSPDPGTNPTPKPGDSGDISTPESGKPGSGSGSGQSWWDKLLSKIGDAIIDGLLGAVSAVLKLIFKLFSTILGWIIWLVSQVLTLFPFLPPGLGALLIGGVVVCFVIGIIKFIRG